VGRLGTGYGNSALRRYACSAGRARSCSHIKKSPPACFTVRCPSWVCPHGTSMLRITGGRVYDPANNINGVVRAVCIDHGRVVANVTGGRTIDATGMVVFPGGVDVHTHVAGAALNFARAMIPEDHRRNKPFVRGRNHRGGIGGATPTTYVTGYLYAGLGYTTVNEAAVPILSARHTHEELRDTPIVDKSTCVLMA